MIKERNIALCIVLSIITCGIYGIIWFVGMTDDAVKVSNGKEYSTSGGTAFLLNLITCGIYSWYWYFKMGKSLYVAEAEKSNTASDNSVLYLILGLFGLGIVSYCLIQSNLNKFAKLETETVTA